MFKIFYTQKIFGSKKFKKFQKKSEIFGLKNFWVFKIWNICWFPYQNVLN